MTRGTSSRHNPVPDKRCTREHSSEVTEPFVDATVITSPVLSTSNERSLSGQIKPTVTDYDKAQKYKFLNSFVLRLVHKIETETEGKNAQMLILRTFALGILS